MLIPCSGRSIVARCMVLRIAVVFREVEPVKWKWCVSLIVARDCSIETVSFYQQQWNAIFLLILQKFWIEEFHPKSWEWMCKSYDLSQKSQGYLRFFTRICGQRGSLRNVCCDLRVIVKCSLYRIFNKFYFPRTFERSNFFVVQLYHHHAAAFPKKLVTIRHSLGQLQFNLSTFSRIDFEKNPKIDWVGFSSKCAYRKIPHM